MGFPLDIWTFDEFCYRRKKRPVRVLVTGVAGMWKSLLLQDQRLDFFSHRELCFLHPWGVGLLIYHFFFHHKFLLKPMEVSPNGICIGFCLNLHRNFFFRVWVCGWWAVFNIFDMEKVSHFF